MAGYDSDSKQQSLEEVSPSEVGEINASGHVQELDRSFGFWSIISLGVASDNAWASGSGALVVALNNGGGPGVLYGLIAGSFFYALIAACLAEMASAIPSSANVYHWASITAGKRYGRVCSFFAGWLNAFAWLFGSASPTLFVADAVLAIYSLYHPDYVPERWHAFIVFLSIVLIISASIMFGQRYMARTNAFCGSACIVFLLVSFLVVVIMTANNGSGYASSDFVWKEFTNNTGWSSPGFVFLMGIANGAFAVGTPDASSHMSEEVPNPKVNIPWAILAQMSTGFLTTFIFYVVLLYGINDFDAIANTNIVSLPLAAIYQQATNSTAATTALLVIFLTDVILCLIGAYLAAGRMLWTLARDDAVPFSSWVRKVHPRYRNPFNAQIVITVCLIILGCIYIGNATAFSAFVGVFLIFTTASYAMAIIPNLLTARRHMPRGPFWMPAYIAYPVMGVASAYILVFNVIYMFPFVYPVEVDTMNYSCVLVGGCTLLLIPWYLWKRTRGYTGPEVAVDARDDIARGLVGMTMAEENEKRHRRMVSP